MTNRIATKMTGSYSQCLSKKSHVSYHIVFITACHLLKHICLQHERKRGEADATRLHCITSNNRVTHRVSHSLLMRRFSSSTSEILVR